MPKLALRNKTLLIAGALFLPSAALAAQEVRHAQVPSPQVESSSPSSAFGSIGSLSDGPIAAGETVHIHVLGAPDFSLVARVSESGDVPYPILGSFHIAGLDSAGAASELARMLKDRNLMADPRVMVTVDSTTTGITILGEVHNPGVYSPPGKHDLSDLIAAAGGLSASAGRIIEITNARNPGLKELVSWDPTMHSTENFDHPVSAGDRVLVRACGILYVGGNVAKPGAYSLCGSPRVTLSELMALAGGVGPSSRSQTARAGAGSELHVIRRRNTLRHRPPYRAKTDGRRLKIRST